MPTAHRTPDARIRNHGSVVLIDPLTASAVSWVDENIGRGNGFQPWYPSVLCEPRYAGAIVDGMRADGLHVR